MCICLCIYNKFERRPFQVITIINDNLLNQFRYMLAHPCWHDYRSTKKACAILESFHIVSYLLFLAVVLSCSFTSLDAQPVFVPISPIKGEMNRVNFFTIKTWLDCLSSHIKIRNVVISFTTHFFSFFSSFCSYCIIYLFCHLSCPKTDDRNSNANKHCGNKIYHTCIIIYLSCSLQTFIHVQTYVVYTDTLWCAYVCAGLLSSFLAFEYVLCEHLS